MKSVLAQVGYDLYANYLAFILVTTAHLNSYLIWLCYHKRQRSDSLDC